MKFLKNVAGFGRRTLRSSLNVVVNVVGAIGRAGLRNEVGLLQAWATWPEGASAPNGTMKCRGHGVPEMVTPAMRINQQFCSVFLNLTNPCQCISFANDKRLGKWFWSSLKSINQRCAGRKNLEIRDPYKNFIFLNNPLTDQVFLEIWAKCYGTYMSHITNKGLTTSLKRPTYWHHVKFQSNILKLWNNIFIIELKWNTNLVLSHMLQKRQFLLSC